MDLLLRFLNSHHSLQRFASVVCKKPPGCVITLLIDRLSTRLITNNCAFCQNGLCRTWSKVSPSQQFYGKNRFARSYVLHWKPERTPPSSDVPVFCSRLAMVVSSIV
jgi:hypothetical protein